MDIEGFINRLGGPTMAAKRFGVQQNTVSSWPARGRIPWRHYLPAKKAAEEIQVELDDAWFEGRAK